MQNSKILLLIIFITNISFCQQVKFAWLSDLHIGRKGNDKILAKIVRSINYNKEAELVVITGDITENGKSAELEKAKQILDSLNVKYFIIPGNHDIKNSESGGVRFSELWGDVKFQETINEIKFIGMNSSIIKLSYEGHLSPEILTWFDSTLAGIKTITPVLVFMHHKPDNWFEVTNRLNSFASKTILIGHGHKNELIDFSGLTGIMSRAAFDKDGNAGYNIAYCYADSISFYEVIKDTIKKQWSSLEFAEQSNYKAVDSSQFNADQTTVEWNSDLKSTLAVPPLTYKGRIYTASYNGIISCFDSTGKLLWDYDTYGNILSKPDVINNILVAGTIQGDLISLNAETGELIQTLGAGETISSPVLITEYTGGKTLMTGLVPENIIIVGTSSGKLLCFDLDSFQPVWENSDGKGMIESRPLHIGNKIIFCSDDGTLYCVDSRSGILIWNWTGDKNIPLNSTPVSDGKNVFITARNKYITAIDLMLGRTNWQNEKLLPSGDLNLSPDSSKILIKSIENKFYIISATDGKLIKEVDLKFGGDPIPIIPIEVDGNIFFGTQSGKIYQVDSSYGYKLILFLGTAAVHSLQKIDEHTIAASNIDGKLVIFKINNNQ